jgi:low affinity Fe/Cu permease
MFHYSDSWQLIINTGTTIVTFLMVFLIQNSQNRDAKAIHLKLDELIRGVRDARTGLVDLEHCTDAELAALEDDFRRVRARERVPPIDEVIAAAGEPPPGGGHSGEKGTRGDLNEDRTDAAGRAEGKPGR